jgi:hypothetical protein
MKSAQGFYPIISDDDTAFAFIELIHYRGTAILQGAGGSSAPLIYVSLMEGARTHMVQTGSTAGIFRPDALAQAPGKAKHFFPGFTIRFYQAHQFVTPAGAFENMAPGDYQGQFHWHDGQGRMTIDASSYPHTADGSRHPHHFSADFAYYSLPIILSPVLQAWSVSRIAATAIPAGPSPQQAPTHGLATAEFLRIPDMHPTSSAPTGAHSSQQPLTQNNPPAPRYHTAASPSYT